MRQHVPTYASMCPNLQNPVGHFEGSFKISDIQYDLYLMSHTVVVILYKSYCMSDCIYQTVSVYQVWVSTSGNDYNFSIRQKCATLYTSLMIENQRMNLLISAVITIPVAFTFFYLRQYYLRTSREVKRLDSLLKSPIYNHVSTTFIGRSSIKSFSLGDDHHLKTRIS